MYSFIDQPVTRLGNGSRFILWAMRAWVHAIGRGNCPPGALAPAFARMGVLGALPDLHLTMALLNRDALEKLSLAPLDCPRIVEDEAILLGLWRDAAGGQEDRALDVLALVVEEDSVAPIMSALRQAAPKLAESALTPSGIDSAREGARS